MDGSLQRNRLIPIGSIAVIVLLYFLAYWLPHRRIVARLQEQIREASEELSNQDQQTKYLLDLRGDLAQIEAHNKLLTQRIPESVNFPEFLSGVTGLSQSDGVTVVRVTPQPMTKLLDLQVVPIRLSLVGQFPAIVRVIHKLETMSRKVEIVDVFVDRESKSEAGDDLVQVVINLKLFARPAKSAAESESSG